MAKPKLQKTVQFILQKVKKTAYAWRSQGGQLHEASKFGIDALNWVSRGGMYWVFFLFDVALKKYATEISRFLTQ